MDDKTILHLFVTQLNLWATCWLDFDYLIEPCENLHEAQLLIRKLDTLGLDKKMEFIRILENEINDNRYLSMGAKSNYGN